MIRAICIVTAFLKLVATYHVPIPTITKEIDGAKVDLNVGVHIDTGDDSPSPGPITHPPPAECEPEDGPCVVDDDCCDEMTCVYKEPAEYYEGEQKCEYWRNKPPKPSTKKPEECLPEGMNCWADNCCDDMICSSIDEMNRSKKLTLRNGHSWCIKKN